MSRNALQNSTSSGAVMLATQKTPEMRFRDDVESVLPCILSNLIFAAVGKIGYQARKDMVLLINGVARDLFSKWDTLYATTVADKASEEATEILKASNEDDTRVIWVAVHHMILKLNRDGVDIPSNLLLVCAGVETEIEYLSERYGGAKRIDDVSARMENKARYRGWWPQRGLAGFVI